MPLRRHALVCIVAGALILAGCANNSNTAPRAGAAATSTAPAATPSPASTGTVKKVSANTASVAQLTAAFTAAGIPNAARWAHEVEEYRPYPANDPNFGKLRGELAKYNPGPGVVDKIVVVLEP